MAASDQVQGASCGIERSAGSSPLVPWKRFWCARDATYYSDPDGFLTDPDAILGHFTRGYVQPLSELLAHPCLVLLGEPGIGKTATMRLEWPAIQASTGSTGVLLHRDLNAYDSGEFLCRDIFQHEKVSKWRTGTHLLHLYLDSLDECKLHVKTVANLLAEQLETCPIERLRLRLFCRTAAWPEVLERRLKDMFPAEQFRVVEILPLRSLDARMAADGAGIDGQAFLREIRRQDVGAFAARPVTLRMLLRLFRASGSFPADRGSLYYEGCLALCSERNASRCDSEQWGRRSPRERLAVAERVAAIMMLCARPRIRLESTASDCPSGAVSVEDVAGGDEQVEGTSLPIEVSDVREVLDTGLFAGGGVSQYCWAHQTFAEYLSARYIQTRGLADADALALLTQEIDGHRRVIPALQETASWLASMDSEFRESLIRNEPQVLVRSDIAKLSADDKRRLVDSLLTQVVDERAHDANMGLYGHLPKLAYAEIASQLEPFVRDRSLSHIVRRFAIQIARDCEARSLLPLLSTLALDAAEHYQVRDGAARMVARLGDATERTKLRPLLRSTPEEDPDDLLRGSALTALWPGLLTAQEMFDAMGTPHNESLMGVYSGFLTERLPESLSPADLPIALRWVRAQEPSYRAAFAVRRLAYAITGLAAKHLDVSGEILDEFVEVALWRMKTCEPLFRQDFIRDDSDSIPSLPVTARRRVVEVLAERLAGKAGAMARLAHPPMTLVDASDVEWLVSKVLEEPKAKLEQQWCPLLNAVLRMADSISSEQASNMIRAARARPEIVDFLPDYLKPLDLQAPDLVKWRRTREEARDQERARDKSGEIVPLVARRIEECLQRVESGDGEAWPQITSWLEIDLKTGNRYSSHVTEVNLDRLPAWEVLSSATRERILTAGERYLGQKHPDSAEWLAGHGVVLGSCLAGYRALVLVRRHRPATFSGLPPETWRLWAPAVLVLSPAQYPESGEHDLMLRTAFAAAPEEIRATLLALIGKQNRADGHLLHGREILSCWDDSLQAALLAKARGPNLADGMLASLLALLLEHNVEVAKVLAAEIVAARGESATGRSRALVAMKALMTHADARSWRDVWATLQDDGELGEQVVVELAREGDVASAARIATGLLAEDLEEDLNEDDGGKRCTPKNESALSDFIKNHLKDDLAHRGIVVNREVEIRPPPGSGVGERTDIHVVAVPRERSERGEQILCIVEVKGCWNRGLETDMETQLRDRYMSQAECRHGLYIVGWYDCDRWDRDDRRVRRTPSYSIDEATQRFDRQAETLSVGPLSIRAFVLNAGLP